jgi:hypothetical protein
VEVDIYAKGKLASISLQNSSSRWVILYHFNILEPLALASLLFTSSHVRHVFSNNYRTFKDLKAQLNMACIWRLISYCAVNTIHLILIVGPSILWYRCEMTNRCVKELPDFINVFQILPRHVSARGCHLQRVVAYKATQAVFVLWAIRVMNRPVWPVVVVMVRPVWPVVVVMVRPVWPVVVELLE